MDDNKDMAKNTLERQNFMKRLEACLKNTGLTLIEISKKTGVPKSNIHAWINGSSPNLFQLAVVARFINVSLDELIHGLECQNNTSGICNGEYVVKFLKRVR